MLVDNETKYRKNKKLSSKKYCCVSVVLGYVCLMPILVWRHVCKSYEEEREEGKGYKINIRSLYLHAVSVSRTLYLVCVYFVCLFVHWCNIQMKICIVYQLILSFVAKTNDPRHQSYINWIDLMGNLTFKMFAVYSRSLA